MIEVREVIVAQRSYASLGGGLGAALGLINGLFAHADARAVGPIRAALKRTYENLRRRHNRPWTRAGLFGSRGGSGLRLRSGRGLRSIRDSIEVSTTGSGVRAEISAGELSMHETGATVVPRRARYLAIPTVFALDGHGNPRRRGPRSYSSHSFVAKTKAGNLFVFQRMRGDRIVPLYLLRKQTKIKARLGLGDTLMRGLPRLADEIGAAVEGS